MQRVQPVSVLYLAVIATAFMLAAPAMGSEDNFVFVPQADFPGNDLLRVDNSSLEDCTRRCDARRDCNAFTYNQRNAVCFLKYSANRVTSFHALAITGIRLSPSVLPTAGASRSGGPSFVIVAQADSPGNDYSRIDDFSFEDCRSSSEADDGCNAFTYNHSGGVCFLKRAANQWTSFYAWARTGIKLSRAEEKTASAAPAGLTSGQAQSDQLPGAVDEPNVAKETLAEQAESLSRAIIGVGIECTGKDAFYQGRNEMADGAYWSVGCTNGHKYQVDIRDDGAVGSVVDCNELLRTSSRSQCFQRIDETPLPDVAVPAPGAVSNFPAEQIPATCPPEFRVADVYPSINTAITEAMQLALGEYENPYFSAPGLKGDFPASLQWTLPNFPAMDLKRREMFDTAFRSLTDLSNSQLEECFPSLTRWAEVSNQNNIVSVLQEGQKLRAAPPPATPRTKRQPSGVYEVR